MARAVRRLIQWLAAGLVAAVPAAAQIAPVAQVNLASPDLRMIELPMPVDRIYPAGETAIVATSTEAGAAILVDARSGKVIGRQALGGVPRAAATYAPPGSPIPAAFAAIVEMAPGQFILRRFTLDPDRGFTPAGLPEPRLPKGIVNPGVSFLPVSMGGKPRGLATIMWDRSEESGAFEYFVDWEGKELSVPTKDPPQEFIPIGSGDWMLGLHPRSDRASAIEMLSGALDDSILVEQLGADDPHLVDVFVPAVLYGGTGDALIANGRTRQLIALTVRTGFPPLIDPPIQIALDALPTDPSGRFTPWIAADRQQSLILVGVAGSDAVQIMRRIRGGIGAFGTVSLGTPVRDAIALHGPAQTDAERFALLGDDGRRLLIGTPTDFEPRVPAVVVASYPAVTDPAATTLNPGNIAQIQRVLASFGYPVGAIDGVAGPRTTAAVRAFQYENELDPNGLLDDQTVKRLTAALKNSGQQGTQDTALRGYGDYLAVMTGAPDLAPRLMTLGVSQAIPDHPCFGLNEPPPEALWPRSVKFAQLLGRLDRDFGLDVQVVSGFRTPAYTRCVGGDVESSHQSFAAFDIRLADARTSAESTQRLMQALDRLRSARLTTFEIREMDTYLHVEPKLGQWHAVIASHSADARGCQFARDDVDEFAALLAGTELRGREILVARTVVSGHYAVTVDANDDRDAARAATGLIQKLSVRSSDRRTGRDSFVQQNTDWFIDPDCAHVRIIQ